MKGKKTGGRQAGTPNKVTKALKEMILEALDGVGGVDYLQSVAETQPAAFMALLGRVLPTTLTGPGPNGEHGVTLTVRYVDPPSRADG